MQKNELNEIFNSKKDSIKQDTTRLSQLSSIRDSKMEGSNRDPLNSDEVWFDDGGGGKYNSAGFMSLYTDDGLKVYKAHILGCNYFGEVPESTKTKLCPFDCSCCF